MKRFAIVACGALLFGWGASSMLGGCGGDEEVTDDPGADATVPQNEAGTGGDDGSTNPTDGGGGGGGDGGGDGGGTGAGSNPGKVTCGGTECNIGTDGGFGFGPYCCVRADGGPTCETNQNACFGGSRLRCDEKSDCTDTGDDCCLTLAGGGGGGGGGFAGSSCQNNCFGTQVRLCKKATDCGDGGACNTITCGGRQYRACNKPAGCT